MVLYCNRMVRTQIQLTEQQSVALRSIANTRNVPVAELIRSSIDSFLQREAASSREVLVARAMAVIGRFDSGLTTVSTDHDDHLAEAYASQ